MDRRSNAVPGRWIADAVVCAAAVLWVVIGTSDGIALSPDATAYLAIAENISEGKGVSTPLSGGVDDLPPLASVAFGDQVPMLRWPPLWPLVWSVPIALGADPLVASRWINVVLFAAAVTLAADLASRLASRWIAGVFAAALICGQLSLVGVYSIALSEPLFVFLLTAAAWLTARYVRSPSWVRLAWVVAAAAAAGFTRYVGLSAGLVAIGVAATFVPGSTPAGGADADRSPTRRPPPAEGGPALGRRLAAGAVASVALIPGLAWMLTRSMVAPAADLRTRWGVLPLGQWRRLGQTVQAWAVPSDADGAARALLAASALGLVIVAAAALGLWASPLVRRQAAVTAGSVVAFYVVLVLATVTAGVPVPLEGRISDPPVMVVAALVSAGVVVAAERGRAATVAVAVMAAVTLVGLVGAADPHGPLGPLPPRPPDPVLAAALEPLPAGTVIFSNDPGRIWRATDRGAYSVPDRTYQETGEPDPAFEPQLDELLEVIDAGGVVIVFDDMAILQPPLATVADLLARDPRLATSVVPGGTLVERPAGG